MSVPQELDGLLVAAREWGASDLHLCAHQRPIIRRDGFLQEMEQLPVLSSEDVVQMARHLVSRRQESYQDFREADLALSASDGTRVRINVYRERGQLAVALRLIPGEVPRLEELGLPSLCGDLARVPRGLVLVTGPTGSGKSTTLAAMVRLINEERPQHIITLEDPIEYLHKNQRAVINQREVGIDTDSFASGLRAALRQDPDVILVGEMRDPETMAAALTAAETGHLVFSTLHTSSASETVERVIDSFPPHQHQQVRVQLAGTLQGVLAQELLPRRQGGRIVALEALVATPAARNLIREGKTHQLGTVLETGKKQGMITMDASLAHLVRQGIVRQFDAEARARDLAELKRLTGA